MKSPAIPIPALPKIPVLEIKFSSFGCSFCFELRPGEFVGSGLIELLSGLRKGLHT